MLDEQLEGEKLAYFLKELLGFSVELVEGVSGGIIHNDEGEEFYGWDENDEWDLYTLRGIIKYNEYLAKKQGIFITQYEIQRALGIS